MKLLILRDQFNARGTSGVWTVDYEDGRGPQSFGYAAEDPDRGLSQDMPLHEIVKRKIKGDTAIPIGRYRVHRTHSKTFGRVLPLLIGVPGYGGIRIHPGNGASDTRGCLLPGMARGLSADGQLQVYRSTVSSAWLDAAIAKEEAAGREVWIEITREPVAWAAFRGSAA